MSPKPDTWMICRDTAWDHYQCGLASSKDSYRFGEAEKHFLRAIELSNQERPNFALANALTAYAALLVKMKRPREAIAMYERRLALKRFHNEDRHERRCTVAYLAHLRKELAASDE